MQDHTPGPWAYRQDSGIVYRDDKTASVLGGILIPIARYVEYWNGGLIAAAPELLEVAMKAVRGKVINNWLTGGRTVCLVCGELPENGSHDEDCWVPLAEAAITKALPNVEAL